MLHPLKVTRPKQRLNDVTGRESNAIGRKVVLEAGSSLDATSPSLCPELILLIVHRKRSKGMATNRASDDLRCFRVLPEALWWARFSHNKIELIARTENPQTAAMLNTRKLYIPSFCTIQELELQSFTETGFLPVIRRKRTNGVKVS